MSENKIAIKQTGSMPSLSTLGQALTHVASTEIVSGSTPFLRLLTDGTWVYGAESTEVATDSVWALNPYSIRHGYVSWADSRVAGELMVPITEPMPQIASRTDAPGDPWQDQYSSILVCVQGEDKGLEVEYKGTSVGLRNAMSTLMAEIGLRAQQGQEAIVPLLRLEKDHYQHRKYGKTYVPELVIENWATMADTTVPEKPAEVPQTRAEPSHTDTPQEEAPRRRRRRQ